MAVYRLRGLNSELVRTCTQSSRPSRSHRKQTKTKRKNQQTKHKKQQNITNKPNDNVTGASSWVINARGDNIISSRHGMAAETKTKTSKPPGHTRGWVKQQITMWKPGIPPARIPEITWRKPKRHNTDKQELMWERAKWNGQWNSLRVRSESAQ